MLSNTCKYALRALIYLGKFSVEDQRIGIKKISLDSEIENYNNFFNTRLLLKSDSVLIK